MRPEQLAPTAPYAYAAPVEVEAIAIRRLPTA
jgi:hypothetical protein